MSDTTKTLPPLPQPYATSVTWSGNECSWQQWHDDEDPLPDSWDDRPPDEVIHVYTSYQMRAYAAAALAAQAQGEPVAWRICVDGLWLHAAGRDGLIQAIGVKFGRAVRAEDAEPLYLAPQPAAQPVSQQLTYVQEADFEVYDGDEYFAGACGPRDQALAEALRYAAQIDNAEVYEVTRRRIGQEGGAL